MAKIGGISGDLLKQYIERIERLEEEKHGIASDVRDLYGKAKIDGFEPKIIRQLLKERKMKAQERDEQEMLLDTYRRALGMSPDFSQEASEDAA